MLTILYAVVVSTGLLLTIIAATDGAVCNPPCQNGVCSSFESGDSFCDCDEGFIGHFCQFVNPCPYVLSCNNGGSCYVDTSTVPGQAIKRCYCMFGYSGNNCEVPDPKCSPKNSPCLNGGACRLYYDNTIHCTCPLGFVGPTCADHPSFTMKIAVYKRGPKNVVIDGVGYDGEPRWSYGADPSLKIYIVELDHKPGMITISGYAGEADDFYGMLVSDSTGQIASGDGWRCITHYYTDEWGAPTYNNSEWPAAVLRGENVDGAVPAVNCGVHMDEFKPYANWIWTADRNAYDYVYCSLKLSTSCW